MTEPVESFRAAIPANDRTLEILGSDLAVQITCEDAGHRRVDGTPWPVLVAIMTVGATFIDDDAEVLYPELVGSQDLPPGFGYSPVVHFPQRATWSWGGHAQGGPRAPAGEVLKLTCDRCAAHGVGTNVQLQKGNWHTLLWMLAGYTPADGWSRMCRPVNTISIQRLGPLAERVLQNR